MASPMAFNDAFLPEFDNEMKTTRSLLERVPFDKAEFKPHAKSMSLRALASHLAQLAGYGAMVVAEDGINFAPPGGPPRAMPAPYSSTEELLEAFDANVRKSRELIAAMPESKLAAQ